MLSSPASNARLIAPSWEPLQHPEGARVEVPAEPIIELRHLTRSFGKALSMGDKIANYFGANRRPKIVHAVDDVNLRIARGEVVGLAGESGCGKSTLGRMVAGILKPTSGNILFKGSDVVGLSGAAARDYALGVQMIFQDPFTSLNPRMKVRDIVGEAALVHGLTTRSGYDAHVDEVLRRVRMDPQFKRRYPHQFSGGQRQRVGIARALAVNPEFIVCDESIAALDVSIQAQILNLFMELRQELSLTYLFISHDLSVIHHLADRVVVMYLGRIVEEAPTEELFARPAHPYTQALLAEIPSFENRKRSFSAIKGELPSPVNPPSGCYFHPRCPHARQICKEVAPTLRAIGGPHSVACHRAEELA